VVGFGASMRAPFQFLVSAILAQRGYLFPWSPVALALGIGIYFALRFEPPDWVFWTCAGASVPILLLQRRFGAVGGPLVALLALATLGFALAGGKARMVSAPVLEFRYYGPIQGRIVGMDRSSSDALRITLDQVVLSRMDPGLTPKRVRVSLHGDQFMSPAPGDVVMMTGHLSPPSGPVEPGGFDFQRHAWFLRLGAVGYTRAPMVLWQRAEHGQWVFRLRMDLSQKVQELLPGERGAFAAAVMTGDRSGMGQDTLQALRDTNLAHLLAISGLHMGLVAGFVFAALRVVMLLVPYSRHYWPIKKLAAGAALIAATGYLMLSGGSVATQRAFVMAAVALVAVMLDRRALSLRSVAMAALLILMWQPQALLSPGFQMSFAATTALVAVFERLSAWQVHREIPRWLMPFVSLLVSSAVAGAATGPVGMAHFNQISQYGLLANLLAVPVMGLIVVPMAVLSALLMPFGYEWIALWVMGLGLDWILGVANAVAQWSGATRPVVAPQAGVLPFLAFGGLVLCLWQGRGRLTGAAIMIIAAVFWFTSSRPHILIADSGGLVGGWIDGQRVLSRPKGGRFVAESWLENDGQAGTQAEAASLWPNAVTGGISKAEFAGIEVIHAKGKRAAARVQSCAENQWVVSDKVLDLTGPCQVFTPDELRQTGSVALIVTKNGPQRVTARDLSGVRLWHPGWQ